MEMTLVTCIIPTKNRPDMLTRAVDSVLNQTYKNIEIIIIDDSTNVETKDIICSYNDKKIIYLKNSCSRGACYSRNIGLKNAKGDYIAFLDDDDCWYPKKIEIQLEYAKKYHFVTCNFNTIINKKKYNCLSPSIITFNDMLRKNYIGSCSFVMISSLLVKDCFFDEKFPKAQDWDFWLNIMIKNNIKNVVNVLYNLVEYNSDSHTRITTTNNKYIGYELIFHKYLNYYSLKSKKIFLGDYLYKVSNKNILAMFLIKAYVMSLDFKEFFKIVKKLYSRLSNKIVI